MQFWSIVKIAHKVTTSSVDRFMHSVRKLDDSPHSERKFGTGDGMFLLCTNSAFFIPIQRSLYQFKL